MLSIIVPTLNEAKSLPQLLTSLTGVDAECVEIIVVDGSSVDDTVAIAKTFNVRVLESVRGRGNQIHRGCQEALGDLLLFLHADSVITPRHLQVMTEKLESEPELIGGNFRLVFDGERAFSKNLTTFYHWIRKIPLYYGDSGIFVRRTVYEEMGGMRQIPIMEDYDFVRRLERYKIINNGKICCIDEPPLITSSRKFEGKNVFQIIGLWIKMHYLFAVRTSSEKMAETYKEF